MVMVLGDIFIYTIKCKSYLFIRGFINITLLCVEVSTKRLDKYYMHSLPLQHSVTTIGVRQMDHAISDF